MSILLPNSCITLGGRAVFVTQICWGPQENCLFQALLDPSLPEFLQGLQKIYKNDRFNFGQSVPESLAGLYCHPTIPHLRWSPEFSHQPELRISWENPIGVLLLSFYGATIAIATVASAFFLLDSCLSLSLSLSAGSARKKRKKVHGSTIDGRNPAWLKPCKPYASTGARICPSTVGLPTAQQKKLQAAPNSPPILAQGSVRCQRQTVPQNPAFSEAIGISTKDPRWHWSFNDSTFKML